MPNLPGQPRLPLHGEIVSAPSGGTGQPLHGEVVHDQATLQLLDFVSFVMDRLVQLPGTNLRVGLNSLLLFVPVLGDIIPALISFGILTVGLSNYRVPRIVAARMLVNSLLDVSIGWIPVLGDLFDKYFKADTRNVRLLQAYINQGAQEPPATWRHWLFILSLLGVFVVVVALIVWGAVAFVHWFAAVVRGTA